ncbi:MAG: AAA family ATPase, partial [Kiritimatiellae bacterium]|nr:AAA family ATPase [Kiritimatiellia bacterium]
FEGRRELFKGLAIDSTDYDWKKHPVLAFNFGGVAASSLEKFESTFADVVKACLEASGYGDYDYAKDQSVNFANAMSALAARSETGQVVVLIDEYDDPVAKALKDPALAVAIRDRLATFYAQLKDRTGLVRFAMVTGVSKFTKISIFSTLSNMVDISFNGKYAAMLGYTDAELDEYFGEHMAAQASLMKLDMPEYRRRLRLWYNGFRFTGEDATALYNPISISNTLADPAKTFGPTWTETGRPSMLMNFLRRDEFLHVFSKKMPIRTTDAEFDVSDLRNFKTVGMLFQTGYLTIKDYDEATGFYYLDVPDKEIARDVALLTMDFMATDGVSWATRIGPHLRAFEWDEFFAGLGALYAKMCYGPTEGRVQEYSYSRILHVLLVSQGMDVVQEGQMASGRADLVGSYPGGVFIFELKVGGTVEEAFAQIDSRGYAEPFRSFPRAVWKIALVFDPDSRKMVACEAREVERRG